MLGVNKILTLLAFYNDHVANIFRTSMHYVIVKIMREFLDNQSLVHKFTAKNLLHET